MAVRDAVADLIECLNGHHLAVLTGAGVSTDSGIPDYRGPGSPQRTPMTFQDFTGDRAARQRYWARSFVGWRRMRSARPNDSHLAISELEEYGLISGVITQNVDGLHQAAGSRRVIDLHGRLDRVICLDCGQLTARAGLDQRLSALNQHFDISTEFELAPDGDAVLAQTDSFVVADCARCGGTLKPDVVFFGESVPSPRVQEAFAVVERAQALLVTGSSLTVYSGLRFVRWAKRAGMPIAIINRGPTRGDDLADCKVDMALRYVLPLAVQGLTGAHRRYAPPEVPAYE